MSCLAGTPSPDGARFGKGPGGSAPKPCAQENALPKVDKAYARPENEDDDGYDPWSDRRPEPQPLFERDPWSLVQG